MKKKPRYLLAAIIITCALICTPRGNGADNSQSDDGLPMQYELTGIHYKIGIGIHESLQLMEKWKANIRMSGPELKSGQAFHIEANVKLIDKEILRFLKKSDQIYMVAVLSPLYNKDGEFRQFTNIQSSCMLTPTGLPIETLQENLPSRFKGNHYTTPWEMTDVSTLEQVLSKDGSLRFAADSIVPKSVESGHYRLAIEFGVRIKGQFVKLELLPYLGPILFKEETAKKTFLTANATEKSKIFMHHSPVFRIGEPATPKMPWTLFGDVETHGSRGIVSREDSKSFAINYTAVRLGKIILPMKTRAGVPITYRLEPDFPTQASEQDTFEKTKYFIFLTVLTHIQLDPVKLNYKSGELEVTVKSPSGKVVNLGKAPFVEKTRLGATTNFNKFNYVFDEYGHYEIVLKGYIKDINGNRYDGGGTYDVWVAEQLSMSTSVKPGMPYFVGAGYNPRVSVHPGFPVDLDYEVKLFRNSSSADVKTWVFHGKANNYGYFFPSGTYDPMIFDAPGEYIATVTATYKDESGKLWMGSQTSASIVAPPDGNITVHGDRVSLRSQSFSPDVQFGFDPKYKLYAGGSAGTPEINDMTTTQIRNFMPYNREDVLFFSPGLTWNVVEAYPFLSYSTKDTEAAKEVLKTFPTFEEYTTKRFGEPLDVINKCYGNYYAVGACLFWLLDMADTFLHKAEDNLPVMSVAKNGYQPYAYQEDARVLNYFYFAAIRPGMISRQVVTDSTNTTAYWVVTPNYFAHQFGAGENGDSVGDMYRFMGGVVYRDLETGKNEYGIYASSGVVGDPRDENDRIEEPMKSPQVKVGGRWYYMIPGMSPEAGAIYEVGDKIVAGGFISPVMKMDYQFSITPPGGETIEKPGSTDSYGLFKVPAAWICEKPGVFTVFFKLQYNNIEGPTVGKPNGKYYLYCVEKNTPYKIRFKVPRATTFDPLDALEIKGLLPDEWVDGKVYFTTVTPGVILSDGELPVVNKSFKYRHVPADSAVFTNVRKMYDITGNRPGYWDTVLITFFADGVASDGKRITAATEVVIRGDKVYIHDGETPKGPPQKIVPSKMYTHYDIDTSDYLYETPTKAKKEDPRTLIKKKCASCHSMNEFKGRDYTYGDWRRIVSWHSERTPLWLRDHNRRGVAEALASQYPARNSPKSAKEKKLIAQGGKVLKNKCYTCHIKEPILDRPHSRTGWKNLLIRQDYWARKTTGKKLYSDEKEMNMLLEYLDLVAGDDGKIPDTPKKDPVVKTFRDVCLNCHSCMLKTYDWKKSDKRAVEMHIRHKLEGTPEEKNALKALDYLYGKR